MPAEIGTDAVAVHATRPAAPLAFQDGLDPRNKISEVQRLEGGGLFLGCLKGRQLRQANRRLFRHDRGESVLVTSGRAVSLLQNFGGLDRLRRTSSPLNNGYFR